MDRRRFTIRDTDVAIETGGEGPIIVIRGERFPVEHSAGAAPFGTTFYPDVYFDSVEKVAHVLIQHRFPGGSW